MRKLPWNIIFSAIFLTGCTQMCGTSRSEMSAEKTVEAYLDIALNMSSLDEKEELIDFTTGNLRAALAGADDAAIQKAYIDKKYDLKRYSLVERRDRTPRETEITYELSYKELDQSAKAEEAPLVTTENTVAVIKMKGLWYIRDVLGNKTSIEFPVTDLNTISAKPAPEKELP